MSDPHAPGADVHSADEAPHLIVDERPTWVRYRVLAFLAVMTFVLYLDRVCLGQAAPLMQTGAGAFGHGARLCPRRVHAGVRGVRDPNRAAGETVTARAAC